MWPVRVAVGRLPYWLPYCTVLDDSDALPPLPSNASVYALTLQWAYRVVFAAPMVVDGETFVPPLLAVYQPWNVCVFRQVGVSCLVMYFFRV